VTRVEGTSNPRRTSNIERLTSNVEVKRNKKRESCFYDLASMFDVFRLFTSMFDVKRSMFDVRCMLIRLRDNAGAWHHDSGIFSRKGAKAQRRKVFQIESISQNFSSFASWRLCASHSSSPSRHWSALIQSEMAFGKRPVSPAAPGFVTKPDMQGLNLCFLRFLLFKYISVFRVKRSMFDVYKERRHSCRLLTQPGGAGTMR
jgi:hypothetical protein